MTKANMTYLEVDKTRKRMMRVELWSAPILITLPIIFSFFLIINWYIQSQTLGNQIYNGQLYLGIIILIGNLIFDIPFIKTLVKKLKE